MKSTKAALLSRRYHPGAGLYRIIEFSNEGRIMFYEGMDFGYYDRAEHKANKAYEFYEDGQMPQALEELETALEINPTNSSWHFDKALALDAIHRFEEAIEEYEIALQLNPDDLEILNSLAVDYTRTGLYDRAIEIFEHIQQLEPAFEPSYCNRVIAYTEMGLHDQAEQMFYLAQQIDPGCPLCYYNMGNSLFVRGQYKQAIGCWVKTSQLEPGHPQINYRIAQAYWWDGDCDNAKAYFLAELRNNPGDLEVILDYGLLLLEMDDIEAAKEKFNRLLEFQPDHAAGLFFLGEIVLHEGNMDRAIDLFNRSLESDESLQGPYYRLAQCALLEGKRKKARAYLISELRNVNDNPQVLLSIGAMFLAVAADGFSSDPTTPSLRVKRSLRPTSRNSDIDNAIHCLLRAMEIDDTNADIYYYMGLASAMKGLYHDAREFFSHTLDIQPDHVGALRDSALIHWRMGQWDKAGEIMNMALAQHRHDPELTDIQRAIKWDHLRHKMYKGLVRMGIRRKTESRPHVYT